MKHKPNSTNKYMKKGTISKAKDNIDMIYNDSTDLKNMKKKVKQKSTNSNRKANSNVKPRPIAAKHNNFMKEAERNHNKSLDLTRARIKDKSASIIEQPEVIAMVRRGEKNRKIARYNNRKNISNGISNHYESLVKEELRNSKPSMYQPAMDLEKKSIQIRQGKYNISNIQRIQESKLIRNRKVVFQGGIVKDMPEAVNVRKTARDIKKMAKHTADVKRMKKAKVYDLNGDTMQLETSCNPAPSVEDHSENHTILPPIKPNNPLIAKHSNHVNLNDAEVRKYTDNEQSPSKFIRHNNDSLLHQSEMTRRLKPSLLEARKDTDGLFNKARNFEEESKKKEVKNDSFPSVQNRGPRQVEQVNNKKGWCCGLF